MLVSDLDLIVGILERLLTSICSGIDDAGLEDAWGAGVGVTGAVEGIDVGDDVGDAADGADAEGAEGVEGAGAVEGAGVEDAGAGGAALCS